MIYRVHTLIRSGKSRPVDHQTATLQILHPSPAPAVPYNSASKAPSTSRAMSSYRGAGGDSFRPNQSRGRRDSNRDFRRRTSPDGMQTWEEAFRWRHLGLTLLACKIPTSEHLENRRAGRIATVDVIGVIDEIATPKRMTVAMVDGRAHHTTDETIATEIARATALHRATLVAAEVGVGALVDVVAAARLPGDDQRERSN